MRIARCVTDNDPFYGLVEDQKVIELAGDPFFHGVQPTQTVHDLDDVRLVALGRICKDVPAESAHDVVFGYTVANDLTARDAQRNDGQWSRAKGFDGSVPLGPWIETELDPDALAITTTVDGQTVQDGNTRDMLTQVAELIAQASEAFTLLPGDVLLTGTPAGVGLLREGQTVEVTIEGIGTLSNRVL